MHSQWLIYWVLVDEVIVSHSATELHLELNWLSHHEWWKKSQLTTPFEWWLMIHIFWTYSFTKLLHPSAAPRCLSPCAVILIPVLWNCSSADLHVLTRPYTQGRQISVSAIHGSRICRRYQHWLTWARSTWRRLILTLIHPIGEAVGAMSTPCLSAATVTVTSTTGTAAARGHRKLCGQWSDKINAILHPNQGPPSLGTSHVSFCTKS